MGKIISTVCYYISKMKEVLKDYLLFFNEYTLYFKVAVLGWNERLIRFKPRSRSAYIK